MVNISIDVHLENYNTSVCINDIEKIQAIDTINQTINISTQINQPINIFICSTVKTCEKNETISKNPFKRLFAWLPAILVCQSVNFKNADFLDYQAELSIISNTPDIFLNISLTASSQFSSVVLLSSQDSTTSFTLFIVNFSLSS